MSDLNWETVCDASDLLPEIGARALLGNDQVAMFRIKDKLFAVNAIDPFTNAAVLARGIVGSLKDQIVVASPLLKQHFNLETGSCLEDETVSIKTYAIRENDGKIQLALK